MIIKLQNKTKQVQEITFITGESCSVFPDGVMTFDEDKVYKEELERAKLFFNITRKFVGRQKMIKGGGKS